MIQLNLLPDVKLEFIKAQRMRRMVLTISILAATGALALLIILFSFGMLQKKHLNDLGDDIQSSSNTLKKKPEIDKILTVQNQLSKLTELHDKKPASSRLLNYLNQLTPSQISLNALNVTYTENTVSISGKADAISNVNQYIDTLKFTSFVVSGDEESTGPAFSDVVMESFSLKSDAGSSAEGKPASFTIKATYDPNLFDITKSVKLSVPKQVTTRSEISQPTDLFQAAPTEGSN